ncbi:hypothetical protein Daus18300_007220 [Diaporthe australafricana]|uniref:Uncharacterized protein n=1 Tax=Diaporthe australafricana TaxID=127596 RepID=A0ABR3WNT9_9PEZI
MKQIKTAAARLSLQDARYQKMLDQKVNASSNEKTETVWTTGQEFQFYVPWLWEDSADPPAEKLHPTRQVVRIAWPKDTLGFTEEFMEAYIRHCVSFAVKDLVDDMGMYFTCTEDQLKTCQWDQPTAWRRCNIVQNSCDLPAIAMSGYDGVIPIEMTMVTKKVFIHHDQESGPTLDWARLPTPGNCIERIKDKVCIHLTPGCSIHIHIRPETLPHFDLESFKKMASLLWLAEERLDELYHPIRAASESPLYRTLRQFSNLALETNSLAPGLAINHDDILGSLNLAVADRNKLSIIWGTSSCYELRELLRVHPSVGKHDSPAYNFFNLFFTSAKQTIEFRKMESTTDAGVVNAWIEVFLLLADFSVTSTTTQFQTILESLSKANQEYNTWKFLRDVGCNRGAIEILKRKYLQELPSETPRLAPVDATAQPSRRDAIRSGMTKFAAKLAESYSNTG